jgi:DNA polymerase-3 subunit alpha
LRVYSEYRLLAGLNEPCVPLGVKEIVDRVKALGMPAVALTDLWNLFGAVEFCSAAMSAGVKPIIGCEVCLVPGTQHEQGVPDAQNQGRLILLVKNDVGYRNLCRILSNAHLSVVYGEVPRMDRDELRKYADGLVALADGIESKEQALAHLDIFGEGNCYLAVQQEPGTTEGRRIRDSRIRLSIETCIPPVAVGDGFHLYTEAEMRALFAHIPEAVDNTQRIAELCDFRFALKSLLDDRESPPNFFPKYSHDGKMTNAELLRSECEKGLTLRYGDNKEKYRGRLEYELSMIKRQGHVDYFLIVRDIVRFAREKGIAIGPGRGVAAGSLVCYVLRITDVDPMRYGLLFERFMNPEAEGAPDIDLEVCQERRGEVVDALYEKYGHEHVAKIIVLARYHAEFGCDPALDGKLRGVGTHGCGYVVSGVRLADYVPLCRARDGSVCTQYDMRALEQLGFLKQDILGSCNLTISARTVRLAWQNRSVKVDLSALPLDDPEAYALIGSGQTEDIYQLGGEDVRDYMRQNKPTRMEDVAVGIALRRLRVPREEYDYYKNHAVSCAVFAYRMAYLKAHFFEEFVAATEEIRSADGR